MRRLLAKTFGQSQGLKASQLRRLDNLYRRKLSTE
ncbi:hypothetical protein DFAR_2620002 [Desulfarculales bacterium]